eukprot:gnl/TRDRNA2_/TRDRNA2_36063_c0_seq1.p1 gnl/TRDRNA2_/TRDRNA2_36063_c0~~gnl/TRDRNA2_/TRDRNA2_36063_c0_seq1.p1  ORF type:complete len:404 (+),score=42.04 gnl/TRDRNA2_/TRDRNA2_36063_c0_seq1:142-1353(+)
MKPIASRYGCRFLWQLLLILFVSSVSGLRIQYRPFPGIVRKTPRYIALAKNRKRLTLEYRMRQEQRRLAWNGNKSGKFSLQANQPNRLAFDIGMNRGDDTARYLQQGYKVIAVEANPEWAARNVMRFKPFIKNKSLVILNNAISYGSVYSPRGSKQATVTIWVPEVRPWLMSFAKLQDRFNMCGFTGSCDRQVSRVQELVDGDIQIQYSHTDERASGYLQHACGCGNFLKRFFDHKSCPWWTCKEYDVPAITCKDMISRYGVPHYVKVDIEGFEGYCMHSLASMPCSALPDYITFEEQSKQAANGYSVSGTEEIVAKLLARGYTQWKISRTNSLDSGSLGTGPWGEEVEDWLTGKKVWSPHQVAMIGASYNCWFSLGQELGDCNVHAKLNRSECQGPEVLQHH